MKPAALGLALLLGVAHGASAERLDGVAAVVGDKVILISELDQATSLMSGQIAQERGPLDPMQMNQLRKKALESLINDRLVAEVAQRNNIAATEEEIDTAIAGIAQEVGSTPEHVYQAAAEQGLSREPYRKELGSQITRMKVISGSVRSRISVSEAEVQELYERRYGRLEPGIHIRARHILLPWPDPAPPAKRAEVVRFAHQLRQQALESGNFAGLARQHSALRSAAQGGFTVLRQDDVSKEIAAGVFELEPDAIGEPIETEHGVNLFQLIDRFDPSKIKLEEVRDVLHSELVERKILPEFERWLKDQRAQRYIGIVLPELR